ncbi:AAA family ATPase [Bacillus sp. 31A1R]|uniref:AAA family ATPase n=1 Tax=Robertmurraya mangrovi TaxID=3098077 RepID=A0ABU5IXY8_9BACI|nr:AAA family ATPase [Bacillus sp. 31A1R]MDZ5472025.1 AAA family ATPase [Bacillus sp. 31A1R]
MDKGNIILLNGVSSSGKSTLSKELTKILPNYYHLSIDDFDIVIERMEDRENDRLIPVPTEYFFHRTIAMFSDKGVNLIVDQILHDSFTTEDCYKTLKDYPVLFVGVQCPIEELERREMQRGDRRIGQGKQQLEYVHKSEVYDIVVDTYKDSLEHCAKNIAQLIQTQELPQKWAVNCFVPEI